MDGIVALVCITETWMYVGEDVDLSLIYPPGFGAQHCLQISGWVGKFIVRLLSLIKGLLSNHWQWSIFTWFWVTLTCWDYCLHTAPSLHNKIPTGAHKSGVGSGAGVTQDIGSVGLQL